MGIFDFFKKNKNIKNDNGLNKIYYNNGKGSLKNLFHKKDGIINDKYYEFNERGDLTKYGKYKNGVKNGNWIYNCICKKKRWYVTYNKGILNGSFKYFELFKSGFRQNWIYSIKDKQKITKWHAKKVGFRRTYISDYIINNEKVSLKDSFVKVLIEEGNCKNGLKEGEWKIYNPTKGQLSDINSFKYRIDGGYYITGDSSHVFSVIWEKGKSTNYIIDENEYMNLKSNVSYALNTPTYKHKFESENCFFPDVVISGGYRYNKLIKIKQISQLVSNIWICSECNSEIDTKLKNCLNCRKGKQVNKIISKTFPDNEVINTYKDIKHDNKIDLVEHESFKDWWNDNSMDVSKNIKLIIDKEIDNFRTEFKNGKFDNEIVLKDPKTWDNITTSIVSQNLGSLGRNINSYIDSIWCSEWDEEDETYIKFEEEFLEQIVNYSEK